jgi:nicotinamide phosphoribosyltransferase
VNINPLLMTDSYKLDHRRQYPDNTSLVYSNLTPRSAKHSPIPPHLFDGNVVNFGLQFFIKDVLQTAWDYWFFSRPKELVTAVYRRRCDTFLGKGAIPVDHIEALHDLGYLPLCIKALPEGVVSPIGVPVLVIYNTHPDFFWLTNYLETVLSNYLWKPITSATIAHAYRKLMDRYAEMTGTDRSFVDFQGHDFSCRGMSGMVDASISGAAHLTSFKGTDTIAAVDLLEQYYNADASREMLGTSVPASEHSCMSMGGYETELDTYRRLITEIYPDGIVSLVSDTYDFFRVVTEYAQSLKPEILARNGKLVFRPDSGDPVKIICGNPDSTSEAEKKGAVRCLWDVFGGTHTATGHRLLDSHVGLIYGDSITLSRAKAILSNLAGNNFCSGNIVLGIGSFTYQMVTRDSFGFAVKSTYGQVDGVGRDIFKNPKTDDGMKKSLRGRIRVLRNENGNLYVEDGQPAIDMPGDQLREVFRDGRLLVDDSIAAIRRRLSGE